MTDQTETQFIRFAECGREYARRWGRNSTVTMSKMIQLANDEQETKFLLAAIVELLESVVFWTRMTGQTKTPPPIEHHIADGMIRCLRRATYVDLPIPTEWEQLRQLPLSVRARRVLIRSGMKMRSEITQESLAKIRGCGPATTCELLEWAEGITS